MPTHSLTNVPEQTHEAMRASANRPVTGATAMSDRAAGGGLEVPGREPSADDVPIVGIDHDSVHEPIPGERDAATLTHREVGAVSAPFNGTDAAPANLDTLMDQQTRLDRVLEGGGLDALRHFKKEHGGR